VVNLFEDESQSYWILVNADNQHSLWPESVPVPAGWRVIHGPAQRGAAVHFVDLHWTDLQSSAPVQRSATGTT